MTVLRPLCFDVHCSLPPVRWGRASTCWAASQYGRIFQSSPHRRGRSWWGEHLQPVSSHPAWTSPLTLPSGPSLTLDHQPTWGEGREGGVVKYLVDVLFSTLCVPPTNTLGKKERKEISTRAPHMYTTHNQMLKNWYKQMSSTVCNISYKAYTVWVLFPSVSDLMVYSLTVQKLRWSSSMVPVGQWDSVGCGLSLLLTFQFGCSGCLKLVCQGC